MLHRTSEEVLLKIFKKMKKDLGEDSVKDSEDEVQKIVKKYESEVEDCVAAREKEIMTV